MPNPYHRQSRLERALEQVAGALRRIVRELERGRRDVPPIKRSTR